MTKSDAPLGLLFVGDVHAASRRPGRRVDDYAAACVDKLTQAVAHANSGSLQMVLLGDLFHRSGENDLSLLAKIMEVLSQARWKPLLLGGSHDRTETGFTDRDAADLLSNAGKLTLLDKPGLAAEFEFSGVAVRLWATPAGYPIPKAVEPFAGVNIMVTHHDMAFRGMYPKAVELKEIENCSMVVNGHMHTPCPMVLKGRTAFHNPGSVTRVSVDLLDHKPVVSAWTPPCGLSLEAIPLVVADNVFDLTGREAVAATPRELIAAMPVGLRLSSFAARLRASEALSASRTDDGSVLVEELEGYFKLFEPSSVVQRYLKGLLQEVIEEKAV